MRYIDALHEKGELLSRAFLEAVLSVCEYKSVYRETRLRLFQVVLLSSYFGHCKNKGVVLREEESPLAEGKTGEPRGKGEEALIVAQITWIHDTGVELKRQMRALAMQVHDVEVAVGTRGENTRGVQGTKS